MGQEPALDQLLLMQVDCSQIIENVCPLGKEGWKDGRIEGEGERGRV